MQQYLIYAFDGTDEQALDRRMAARPAHLEYIRGYKERGNFILGAAMLDDSGKMIGSNVVFQFETKSEFDAYFENEPYNVQGVWKNITIHPIRVANV